MRNKENKLDDGNDDYGDDDDDDVDDIIDTSYGNYHENDVLVVVPLIELIQVFELCCMLPCQDKFSRVLDLGYCSEFDCIF